jgi:hypothetical protein
MNVSGACEGPSEWVEQAVFLADEYVDAALGHHLGHRQKTVRRALRAHLEAKEWEHQSDREVTVKVCNEMGALQALVKQLVNALAGERHMRNLGQQPDVHWESLRDMRRAACEATDAALAAHRQHVATQEKT